METSSTFQTILSKVSEQRAPVGYGVHRKEGRGPRMRRASRDLSRGQKKTTERLPNGTSFVPDWLRTKIPKPYRYHPRFVTAGHWSTCHFLRFFQCAHHHRTGSNDDSEHDNCERLFVYARITGGLNRPRNGRHCSKPLGGLA